MGIKILLWDVDGTILNFKEAEKAAIRKGFKNMNLGECSDEMISDYSNINDNYWKRLERGELTKKEILVMRFRDFFGKYGLDTSLCEEFNSHYQVDLGDTVCFNDDAYDIIKNLKGKYLQFVVSNGTKVAQTKKLERSGIGELMEGVFISDVVGYEKPSCDFFERVFEKIREEYTKFDLSEVMIIGDSLTSDIKGGNNAGIITCYYNPKIKKENDAGEDVVLKDRVLEGCKVDFEIGNLHLIYDILSENIV